MDNMNSACALICTVAAAHRSFFSILLTQSKKDGDDVGFSSQEIDDS